MFGVGDGGVTITGTKTGTDVHAGFGGEPPKLVFDLVGSSDHQGVQLVDGLGTGLDRRTADHWSLYTCLCEVGFLLLWLV